MCAKCRAGRELAHITLVGTISVIVYYFDMFRTGESNAPLSIA